MIKEFKTKEQLKKDHIYELSKNLEGIKKDRFIRLSLGEEQNDDRLFFSNLLVGFKFSLKKIYIELEKYYEEREIIKTKLEHCNDCNLIKYNELLNKLIKSYKNSILSNGEVLTNYILPNINKYFSEHEIIQLVGSSEVTAKEYKETIKRLNLKSCKDKDGGFAFDFIYHHGEYRWRKGRSIDFIDCPKWEMPLFNCIVDYLINEMKTNSELRKATNSKMEEFFGDAMVYATFDNNGNILNIEKANKEITVLELLLYYKDLEPKGIITKIKKENIIDVNKTLKLHKNKGNNYTVLNDKGETLGLVLKKNK